MRAKIIVLAVTALVASGCDKTTDPSPSLTNAEIRAIVLAMDDPGMAAVNRHQAAGFSTNLTPTRPATDIIDQSGNFSFTHDCDLGGGAAIAGTGSLNIDTDVPTFDIGMEATATYTACRFETEDDTDVVLTGAVTFAADRHAEPNLVSGTQSYAGTLDYDLSNGKQGTCLIDIEAAFSLESAAASRSLTGTVCDQSVDVTESWTASV